jgi:hypothetical protein
MNIPDNRTSWFIYPAEREAISRLFRARMEATVAETQYASLFATPYSASLPACALPAKPGFLPSNQGGGKGRQGISFRAVQPLPPALPGACIPRAVRRMRRRSYALAVSTGFT